MLEFITQSAEHRLQLADASIDTALVTRMLCSIPKPLDALQEVRRVLKRDGTLIFVEHGQAPDSAVAARQKRLTPIWKRIAGGCHLNRQIDALIEQGGFQISDLKTFYLPGPRPMTFTYQGIAVSS